MDGKYMAFKAPSISKPKIRPGWIYCIRDEDYLDQSISRYVKLGLTERTVEERIQEHQTGNPRREFEAIDSKYLEMMHYAETYLHHAFAPDRIAGEWFDMDDARLAAEVGTLLDDLETEMQEHAPFVQRWYDLNDVLDNTLSRPPAGDEPQWAAEFKDAYERMTVAKAIVDTHKNNLLRELGTAETIDRVMYISPSANSATFNKDDFEALVTPAQVAQCVTTTTRPDRKLEMLDKGDDLATLNPTVKAAFDASEVGLSRPSATNMSGVEVALSQAIQDEHMALLEAMKDVKAAEWDCIKAQAKLIDALDDHREIEGIIRWKRQEKTETKFESSRAKELFEAEYNAARRAPTNPFTYKTEYHYMRKYNP
jgi:hypothetical protein